MGQIEIALSLKNIRQGFFFVRIRQYFFPLAPCMHTAEKPRQWGNFVCMRIHFRLNEESLM